MSEDISFTIDSGQVAALALNALIEFTTKQEQDLAQLKQKEELLDNLLDLVDARDEITHLKALLDANGIDYMRSPVTQVEESEPETAQELESEPQPEKPKRTRRTKAQIEADKKAEEEAKQAAAKKAAEERVAAVSAEATKQETPAPSQANGDRVLRFKELAAGNFQLAGSLVREAGANRFTELSEAKQDVVLGKLQEQDGPDSLV